MESKKSGNSCLAAVLRKHMRWICARAHTKNKPKPSSWSAEFDNAFVVFKFAKTFSCSQSVKFRELS